VPSGNPLYSDYQPVADDNQAAAPIGAPEGNYRGEWVNDTFRHMMAVIRKLGDGVLHHDGSVAATANLSMGGFQLRDLGVSTNRTSAATTGQLQDGTFDWGGATTGSGAAYVVTLSPLFTATTYRTGQTVRCPMHAANTTTTPTLLAGSAAGAKTIVHRNGAALRIGDLGINSRQLFEFDGTNWRALTAAGYMDQLTYDQIYPVGTTRLMNANDVSLVVPAGVSATWALLTPSGMNRFLLLTEGGANVIGGSALTGVAGTHAHSVSGTTGGPSATVSAGSAGDNPASGTHVHSLSGSTTNDGDHQHSNDPPWHSMRAFIRTA
jgi:hypothetical protein